MVKKHVDPSKSIEQRAEPTLLRMAIVTGGTFFGLLTLTVGTGFCAFGGIRPAMSWWQGSAVYVDPPICDLGTLSVGELKSTRFRVRNLRTTPLKIVGATADCSCVTMSDLPVVLPPRGQASIEVNFVPGSGDAGREVVRAIPLHLNVDSLQAMLTVRAQVIR